MTITEAARLCKAAEPGTEPSRMLLLHGLGGSNRSWEAYLSRASAETEVWEADLPWMAEGDSAWSHDPDPTRWIKAALQSVEGGADVVVAHSFAANVLLDLVIRDATLAPPALVLVSPFYRAAPVDFDWATMAYYLNGFHLILDEGLRISSGGRLRPKVREHMALRMRDRIGPYGWMRFFDAYTQTPFLKLSSLTSPLLVIAGTDDLAAPFADAEALAEAAPDGRLAVLDGGGHFAMAEDPDWFAAALHDFLVDALPTTPLNQRDISEPA